MTYSYMLICLIDIKTLLKCSAKAACALLCFAKTHRWCSLLSKFVSQFHQLGLLLSLLSSFEDTEKVCTSVYMELGKKAQGPKHPESLSLCFDQKSNKAIHVGNYSRVTVEKFLLSSGKLNRQVII